MGINIPRVLVGGIVAGLVIDISESILNSVVLGAEMNAAIARMNLTPAGNQVMVLFLVLGLLLGIATIWLYAAIRPRYGAGPKTALCAGAAVWFFGYLYPSIGMLGMGMFSTRVMAIGLAWGLVELLVASLAGAFLYKE
jgi:hypothetical protein